MKVCIQAAVRSDRGMVRRNNEDNFFFTGETMALSTMDAGASQSGESGNLPQLYAVCDGMGGEEAGEEASTLTVELLSELEDAPMLSNDILQAFIEKANERVLLLREKTQGLRVGCTIVLACVEESGIRIAHVGDSRAYRVSGEKISQWTRDHTEAERLRDLGVVEDSQDVRKHHRNALTQHLGATCEEVLVTADISKPEPLRDGDVWILCSDGISDMLSSEVILQNVLASGDAKTICDRLVNAALRAGGHDNTTAIVLRIIGGNPADRPEHISDRIKASPKFVRSLMTASFCVLLVCVSLLLGIAVGKSMRQPEVAKLQAELQTMQEQVAMAREVGGSEAVEIEAPDVIRRVLLAPGQREMSFCSF